jgi:hypothetical protein
MSKFNRFLLNLPCGLNYWEYYRKLETVYDSLAQKSLILNPLFCWRSSITINSSLLIGVIYNYVCRQRSKLKMIIKTGILSGAYVGLNTFVITLGIFNKNANNVIKDSIECTERNNIKC